MVTPSLSTPESSATVIFHCYLEGNITWYFNNEPLLPNTAAASVAKNHSLLVIASASPENEGTYQCIGIQEGSDTYYQAEGKLIIDDSDTGG